MPLAKPSLTPPPSTHQKSQMLRKILDVAKHWVCRPILFTSQTINRAFTAILTSATRLPRAWVRDQWGQLEELVENLGRDFALSW
jgi:hypothetical protein